MINKIKDYINNIFKKNEYSIFFKTGYLLVGSLFLPIFIASLFFILNISINIFEYILGIVLLFVSYYYFFYDKKNKKDFFIPIIIAVILYLACLGATYFIIDNTWDGYAYHLPAVIHLANGWNPLYEHIDKTSILNIWSVHYPKAGWIHGALLYKITGYIFAPTAFNFIIALGSSFILYDLLYKLTKKNIISILSAIIISFNIILVGQLYTMYNDGVLGLCVLASILIYIAVYKDIYKINKVFNPINILLVAYLSILANVKFTGALFAFIIFLVYTVFLYFKKKFKFDKVLIFYTIIIGIGVAAISINTYLPNLIYHDTIGYPLTGKDKKDIITYFVPDYTSGKGRIVPFLKSVTMDSSQRYYRYNPPYYVSTGNFDCIAFADCAKQGFGPFYQMILILLGIITIITIIRILSKRNIKKEFLSIIKNYQIELISLLVLFIFFLITPATWWSRYIPYIYPLPLLMVVLPKMDLKKLNIVSYLTVSIIVLFTIQLVVDFSLTTKKKIELTRLFKSEISVIEANKDKELMNINSNNYKLEVIEEITNQKIIKYNYSKCPVEIALDYIDVGVLNCDEEVE